MKALLIISAILFASPMVAFAGHGELIKQLSISDGSPQGNVVYHDSIKEGARGAEGPAGRVFDPSHAKDSSTALESSYLDQSQITDGSVN